ncbi:MAG: hypothetical protein JWN98_1452, partial [Abditibacteriota bacterium]|nr:hypothetical protein [Abditibacteriota bacterium]
RNDSRRSEPGALGRGVALSEIEAGSIAEELGIQPGDRLLQINEQPARDAIQLKMADTSEHISLTIIGADGQSKIFDIEKDAFEPVGIGVDSELFDGVKRCTNKCPFCFVDQLPPRLKNTFGSKDGFKNLRRTLYVRDDDYRLSFLHGHYITLTNLKQADYQRIIEEKLTPLCVSVHATDPATRIKMLGNASGGDIMGRLKFLIENGIQINSQIVLCPEVNDGALLEQSVRDLMSLWPGVESVAVVPAGLTKWLPDNRGMRTVRPDEACVILAQLKPLQREAMKKFGTRFVYASDEMYLLADQPVPGARFYDGFPQFANGVGTVRYFLDEVAKVRRRAPRQSTLVPQITLVTGTLAAPALRELASALNEKQLARAEVCEIKSTFWGGNVGCAGLIMGEEVLAALKGKPCGDMVFLPPDAVDNQNRMLDDITLEQLSRELNTTVRCDATGPLQIAQLLSKN